MSKTKLTAITLDNGKTIKRHEATEQDYFAWVNRNEDQRGCKLTSNPAFLSAHTDEEDTEQAKSICSKCPLMNTCNFFAKTKVFKHFDGVMGGVKFEDKLNF